MTAEALARLEDAVRRDLEYVDQPTADWVPPRHTPDGARVLDVAIIGGGQSGLGIAAALARHRVTNLVVLDENPPGLAGPWRTFARMQVLRTPKEAVGIDGGLPSLTTRAWYEAAYGPAQWQALGPFLPRALWAEYLDWFRRVLAIPVRDRTRAGAVTWNAERGYFELPLSNHETIAARKVVLATGLHGAGRWFVPDLIARGAPPGSFAHTSEAIDFGALAGKRVAVIGAGASAFDNAACALEAGARGVDLLCRRACVPVASPYRWGGKHLGFLRHHGELPAALRWTFVQQLTTRGEAPPRAAVERVAAYPGFRLHEACTLDAVRATPGGLRLATTGGDIEVDFLIVATRFVTDLSSRPELAELWPDVATWSDRYTPPPEERDEDLGRHPYLGAHFELTERVAGAAPQLGSVFCFNWGALLSLGYAGGNILGMRYAIPRLVTGITGQLYREDADAHLAQLAQFSGL